MSTNTDTIDRLVEGYNASDARTFADCFALDASVYEHPSILTQQGRNEIFAYYQKLFAEFPQNRTEILHRIVFDTKVIDHERVRRSPDAEPFEVLTIYEMSGGLIQRVDFIRKQSVVFQAS